MIKNKMIDNSTRRLTLKNTKSNKTFSVFSPNDGKEIAKVETPCYETQQQIIEECCNNFKVISQKPDYKIAEILNSVADKIHLNSDYLTLLISTEGGKPLKDAKVEVSRSENTLRECAKCAVNRIGETIPMEKHIRGINKTAYTKLYPIGLVLAISAFNHPLNLLCHQVGTAIAAKCPIILKPAETTPLCAFELYNYFIESGLDYGVFHIIAINGEETSKLIGDKRFKFVNFIGSEKVGWEIWKNVYPGTKVQFEHGGTGSAIIMDDADIYKSAESLIKSSFYHSGQVCVSTQNVFVHNIVYDKFKTIFLEKASNLKVGTACDINTDCGPIIKKSAVENISKLVDDAVKNNARLLLGGKLIIDNYYEVTVLENVKPEMDVYQKEIFGPVVNLIKFDNLDNLIEEINKSEFAFQTCIFTKNFELAYNFCDKIEQKAIMINENNAFRVDWMPFGGYKKSGYGIGGVQYAINDMSIEKLIVINNKL